MREGVQSDGPVEGGQPAAVADPQGLAPEVGHLRRQDVVAALQAGELGGERAHAQLGAGRAGDGGQRPGRGEDVERAGPVAGRARPPGADALQAGERCRPVALPLRRDEQPVGRLR